MVIVARACILLILFHVARASHVEFDPFKQNAQLKEKLEFFNEKGKKLEEEQKALIEKVKANWEKRNASMNSALDEKASLQEGVDKLKKEYKEKEHCLQDWLDAHSEMKESVMNGLHPGALVEKNSIMQPMHLRGPGGFHLLLREPSTPVHGQQGSASETVHHPGRIAGASRNPLPTTAQNVKDPGTVHSLKYEYEYEFEDEDDDEEEDEEDESVKTMKALDEEEKDEDGEMRVMEQEDAFRPVGEIATPPQSAHEMLHEGKMVDQAAAVRIIEAAVKPARRLRHSTSTPSDVTSIHMTAAGTGSLAHQEERMKIIEGSPLPDAELAPAIHMMGGSRAVQDQGEDKMKVIKENDALQQAVDLARSDAQRLFLTNQKYAATLEAADTRTEHWDALIGRMEGTYKAQEDNLKAQIAHLDQKCKEVEEIKGVPDKIKENFDALKSKEQDVLEDMPLEENPCFVKDATTNKHRKCKSFSMKTNVGKGAPDDPRKMEDCKEFCKGLGNKYRFSVGKKGGCRCCEKDGNFKKRPKGRWRTFKAKNCR
eukprot:gnl/MRDRNA2_/MRDRNA2_95162_c0_seq1.p1 gnl/MRDRNA2_/MRDRNA2_95162_c0~~gnl/MRDRNA2_/MRDRNA2_95162_c0_seq1.p1  ORF type:complete len:541 (+),score=167.09 gnl/MRDRNA2_/MRDRNA2_95162_c0_seq1:82-1704(+)